MKKYKLEIKSRFFGKVLFSYESDTEPTKKEALEAAVKEGADLKGADLKGAYLEGAYLEGAYLEGADLKGAYLEGADLKGADLKGADLEGADLEGADLEGADLEGAKGLIISQVDFLSNFEKDDKGVIVYKSFNETYNAPDEWEIKPGSIISEIVDGSRASTCSSGINVASVDWCREKCTNEIWKCRIQWEWLPGVVVPFMSDGKFRTERLELIEVIRSNNE